MNLKKSQLCIEFSYLAQEFENCEVIKINVFILNIHFASQIAAPSTLLPGAAAPLEPAPS
jgi:hypothetical protein